MGPEGSLPHSHKPSTCPFILSQGIPVCVFPSHSLKSHFNITLPSMPEYSKWSLYLRFPTSLLHTCCMPHPHHSWFGHLNNIWWVQIIMLLIIAIPTPPVTSSLWGPNFLLSTLFLNTFSLCPYLNVRDQVSYPHNLYILIFIFLGSKLEDRRFCTEWQQAFPYFKLLWTRHLQNTT